MHLMGDAGASARRLGRPGSHEERTLVFDSVAGNRGYRGVGRCGGRGYLSREHRQAVLNRLELRDRPAELAPVRSVSERLFQAAFERAGHLSGVHGRTHPPQPFSMIRGSQRRVRGRGHPIDEDGIARFPGERRSRFQAATARSTIATPRLVLPASPFPNTTTICPQVRAKGTRSVAHRGRPRVHVSRMGSRACALAHEHRLSGYDATYLELAVRMQLPLATLDQALGAAGRAEGLDVLAASP